MARKPRPLIDLLLSIIIPSIVLMQFSDDDQLGAHGGLVVALSFPIALGLYEIVRYRVTNYIALLGLLGVLLTGGIGLLELDVRWLAVKEAAIPALLGMALLMSAKLRYPLIKTLVFNSKVLDTGKISGILSRRGHVAALETRLLRATYFLSATFFFSAVMNYLMATWIVTSPTGSAAFNEELGRLTLISYPVIAIPSLMMMLAIVYFLWRSIHRFTGLKLEELFAPALSKDK